MKNYIYVVVIVGEDHNAKTAVIAGDKELKGLSLSRVLAMGYSPVRESAMSGGGVAHSLILLERDGNGAAPAAMAPAAEKAASPLPSPAAPVAAAPAAAPKPALKAAVVSEPKKAVVAPKAAPAEKAAAAAPAAAAAAAGGEGGEKKKVSDSDISFDFLNDVDE